MRFGLAPYHLLQFQQPFSINRQGFFFSLSLSFFSYTFSSTLFKLATIFKELQIFSQPRRHLSSEEKDDGEGGEGMSRGGVEGGEDRSFGSER